MVALCLLFSLASYTGRGQFCATVIGVNWLVWCMFIALSGVYDPWALGVAVDGFSAAILLWPTTNKARAWFALTYCLQIAAHIAYGLAPGPDPMVYYWSVGLIGWAQLVMGGMRAGGHWLLLFRDRLAVYARQAGLYRVAVRGGVHGS